MAKKLENLVAEEAAANLENETKESERWIRYYYDNIYEDEEDIQMISETAIATIRERFHIVLTDHRIATAAFLKPLMETSPFNGLPPDTTYFSKSFLLLWIIFSVYISTRLVVIM